MSNSTEPPLSGRVALVTGAARRVGRAIASGLADAGASVIVHYNRSSDGAEELAADLARPGRRAWTLQADLSDASALDAVLERAWELGGRVDLLVNNASIFPAGSLAEIDFEDVTRNMAVNAWAPLALTRALWARASEAGAGAAAVNLLDSRLVGGDPLHAAYFVSKVALAEFTRASALAFAPTLRVNAVAPGPILPPEDKDEAYLRLQLEQLPLRRWGGPEQIAQAVLYLATAAFVTGQVLFVDGGQHLQPGGPR